MKYKLVFIENYGYKADMVQKIIDSSITVETSVYNNSHKKSQIIQVFRK